MTEAHRHVDLEINYVLSGSMTYLVGGRIVELPPRCLCLLWGGVPHQMIRAPRPAEAIWVTIPLSTVLRWGLPDPFISALLTIGYVADAAPRPEDLALLQQWLTDLPGRPTRQLSGGAQIPSETNAAHRIALLEIEARLRRFALGLNRPSSIAAFPPLAAHTDHGLASVEVMAQFVAQNFRNEIGIAEIAETAHLHPHYAMTLFRRHTGMTLSQYLVLQRVAHAQRLLATTGDPIAEIAFDSGFGSISRFYEAFRRQTGSSPRRFRLQMEPAAGG